VLNGPRLKGEKDGPEKVYVLILDNGRSRIYQDSFLREALRCVRCGRCGTVCPVYLHIGAYPYGWCYPGPMGVILAPLLLGLDQTRDLYEACTLCGACEEACPAGVPHVSLIQRYREMKAEGSSSFSASGAEDDDSRLYRLLAKFIHLPWAWSAARGLLKFYGRLKGKNGYLEQLPGPLANWFVCRDLPLPPPQSFRQLWQQKLAFNQSPPSSVDKGEG
jgi:L-lactate dehydrogenase complex protein LldF